MFSHITAARSHTPVCHDFPTSVLFTTSLSKQLTVLVDYCQTSKSVLAELGFKLTACGLTAYVATEIELPALGTLGERIPPPCTLLCINYTSNLSDVTFDPLVISKQSVTRD